VKLFPVIWSRSDEEFMPLIVPEQTFSGDEQVGQRQVLKAL
jgi:hypothetical protein